MKKLSIMLFAVLLLVGCSSKEPEEVVTVCTSTVPNPTLESSEQTITSKGDVITKLYAKGVMDLGSEEHVDAFLETYDLFSGNVNSAKGVATSTERIDDTKVLNTVDLDFEIGDIQEIAGLGLLTLDSDKNVESLSLQELVNTLESRGHTCK